MAYNEKLKIDDAAKNENNLIVYCLDDSITNNNGTITDFFIENEINSFFKKQFMLSLYKKFVVSSYSLFQFDYFIFHSYYA